MKTPIKTLLAAAMLSSTIASAPAQAASAAPLSYVEIIQVRSSDCGWEDLYQPFVSTTCDHGGKELRVFVLELGYGRGGKASIRGDELPRSALVSSRSVCFINRQLVFCPVGVSIDGFLHEYKLDGYQGGRFAYENTSINYPYNTMSRWIIIW